MRGMRMKRMLWITIMGATLMTTMAASGASSLAGVGAKPGSTKKSSFGKTPDGEEVDLYTLTNKNGVEAAITNYGGAGGLIGRGNVLTPVTIQNTMPSSSFKKKKKKK